MKTIKREKQERVSQRLFKRLIKLIYLIQSLPYRSHNQIISIEKSSRIL